MSVVVVSDWIQIIIVILPGISIRKRASAVWIVVHASFSPTIMVCMTFFARRFPYSVENWS